jgi:tRNA(Ile)-lysidine synthase
LKWREGELIPDNDKSCAWLNADLLKFPLSVRSWHKGDSFFPLGMKGRKKLSDFFIDLKLSPVEKEQVKLLCSGDQIVWVIGYRIDDRYRIKSDTQRALVVTLK